MTALTGFGLLARFTLRRDRVRLPIWIAAIAGLVVVSGSSVMSVYPDQAAVDSYVALFGDNPMLVAFAGPGHGFDDPNIGVVLVNEVQLFGCVAVALMSIFLVTRHTRAEEDTERAELVRAAPIGHHAPAAAALAVVCGANLLVGALCTLGLVGIGFELVGSLAMAGSLAAVGLAFAGITVAAAQVFSSGRATLGWCSGVLAVAFVVRAAGDIGGNGLSWLSPIGWAQAVRPYAGERWWTLGLCCLAGGALVGAALWLATRRDLGSGLLPPRLGTGAAAPWMTHPLGLALRLQRGALIGWTVALFLTGVVYGSIGEDVDRMLEENEAFADVFTQLEGASLTDSFFATAIAMLALIAAGFTVSSTLSLRTEEVAGRAEHMLATPTSRSRWLASQLAVAVAGTCVTITAAGLGAGLAYALVVDDPGEVLPIVGAAAATVPAVLVLVGVVTVLFGLVPRAAPAAWIALAVMVLIGFFGELLRLPEWSTWISPLEHAPAAPAETVTLLPLALLLAVAAALVAVGLWGFRRRDLLTQ